MKSTKKRKIVFFILLFLNCIFLAAFVLATHPPISSKTYTVTLTDAGFTPQTLTIHTGDTVSFVNKTKTDFWPASDPHPTHTIFSAFDPKHPIKPTTTWSFRFTKTGTWPYHDHLLPIFTGTITVEGSLNFLSFQTTPEKECNTASIPELCWEQQVQKVLDTQGVSAAFDQVDYFYQHDPSFKQSCHGVTHFLGQAAYKSFITTHQAFGSAKASYCGYGFYHAFMENLLHDKKQFDLARTYCTDLIKQYGTYAYLACFHGIGHGMLEDIPNPILNKPFPALLHDALTNCEKIAETDPELERCSSGVFNVVAIYYANPTINIPKDHEHPFALCLTFENQFEREACLDQMNTYVLDTVAKSNFPIATTYVENLTNKTDALHAMHGLSSLYGNTTLGTVPYETVVNQCHQLDNKTIIPTCISAFAEGLIEGGKPGKEYQEALNFCTIKSITSSEQHSCFIAIYAMLQGIYSTTFPPQICEKITLYDATICNKQS
jgi:plastocyanin